MTSLHAAPNTMAGLVQATRRLLSPNLNDELVIVDTDYAPGDTTMRLRVVPRRIGPGSVLSWREASMYVTSLDPGTSTVEVITGYDGGADVAVPAGSVMRVNPRFTDLTLFDMLANQTASLSSPSVGLHGFISEFVSGSVTDGFHPIPSTPDGPAASDVLRVAAVLSRPGSGQDWVRVTNYSASLSPSNPYVRVFDDSLAHQIVYAVRIRRPLSFDDDVVALGLPETAVDIPPLGVAALLMQGQEARRAHQRVQGDPRRAEDVPITGALGVARDLRRIYEDRVNEEYARLQRFLPTVFTGGTV